MQGKCQDSLHLVVPSRKARKESLQDLEVKSLPIHTAKCSHISYWIQCIQQLWIFKNGMLLMQEIIWAWTNDPSDQIREDANNLFNASSGFFSPKHSMSIAAKVSYRPQIETHTYTHPNTHHIFIYMSYDKSWLIYPRGMYTLFDPRPDVGHECCILVESLE